MHLPSPGVPQALVPDVTTLGRVNILNGLSSLATP